jgi:hypothetical protein
LLPANRWIFGSANGQAGGIAIDRDKTIYVADDNSSCNQVMVYLEANSPADQFDNLVNESKT